MRLPYTLTTMPIMQEYHANNMKKMINNIFGVPIESCLIYSFCVSIMFGGYDSYGKNASQSSSSQHAINNSYPGCGYQIQNPVLHHCNYNSGGFGSGGFGY